MCSIGMEENRASHEMNTLRSRLDGIDGIETVASRPGNARENRFQGYVTMNAGDQNAVERLLNRLGDPFWALFHIDDQKCEMGFRVEVTISQTGLRYELRFWGCPEWGLHRIRQYLARRIAGDVDRSGHPPLRPPGEHEA